MLVLLSHECFVLCLNIFCFGMFVFVVVGFYLCRRHCSCSQKFFLQFYNLCLANFYLWRVCLTTATVCTNLGLTFWSSEPLIHYISHCFQQPFKLRRKDPLHHAGEDHCITQTPQGAEHLTCYLVLTNTACEFTCQYLHTWRLTPERTNSRMTFNSNGELSAQDFYKSASEKLSIDFRHNWSSSWWLLKTQGSLFE